MSQPTEKPLCKTLGCIFERDHLGDHSFALRSSRSSSPAPAPTEMPWNAIHDERASYIRETLSGLPWGRWALELGVGNIDHIKQACMEACR